MRNIRWSIFGVLLVVTLCAGFSFEEPDTLTVAFLDVGQGDAIYIEAPNGKQVLIDGGPNKSVLRELGKVMPFYDRSIDIVLLTHPDKDHVGGLPAVLQNFSVDMVFEPGVTVDTGVYQAFKDEIEVQSIERHVPFAGSIITLDEGVELEILFPDRDMSTSDPNTASIIARLVYGESEFLFMGDAPKAIERYVLSRAGDIESDVLKVGHHGSDTSTDSAFVARVNPAIAIISAGKDNRYGHPHEEVLDTLQRSAVVGTYQQGTIVFKTDGKGSVAF